MGKGRRDWRSVIDKRQGNRKENVHAGMENRVNPKSIE